MTARSWAVGAFALLLFAPATDAAEEKDFTALVSRLGSTSSDEVEAATKELAKSPAALAALYEAVAESKSPDVRSRAEKLITQLNTYDPRKQVGRLSQYVKKKQLDRVIAVCGLCRDGVSKEEVKLLQQVREDVVAFALEESGGTVAERTRTAGKEFTSIVVKENIDAEAIVKAGHEWFKVIACGERITFDYFWRVFGVASGSCLPGSPKQRKATAMSESVLFCTTTSMSVVDDSILVVCGDLGPERVLRADNAIILCTGDILDLSPVDKSIVIAGGKIDMGGQRQRCAESRLLANNTKLLEHFDLFDTAKEGMKLEVDVNQLTAKCDKGRYREAGLRTGDVVLGVNGKAVSTATDVNRLLCQACVTHGHAVIKIKREKTVRYYYVAVGE